MKQNSKQILLIALAWACAGPVVVAQELVSPLIPRLYEVEQQLITQRRNDFLGLVKRANNVTTPMPTSYFSWKIDVKGQQAYCKDMVKAIFKERGRLSFPEPTISLSRDPADKLLVGAPARQAAVEDEIEIAVAARPEDAESGPGQRAPGHVSAGAPRRRAEDVDERRRMRKRGDHCRLR